MALTAADAILPLGALAPDLVPRTPDEVKAYKANAAGHASDTEKTASYVDAFLVSAYADARVAALATDALTDAAARLYAYARAWRTRADVLVVMPSTGSADKEGSYAYLLSQIRDARAIADAYEAEFAAAVDVTDPVPVRRSRTVTKPVAWA